VTERETRKRHNAIPTRKEEGVQLKHIRPQTDLHGVLAMHTALRLEVGHESAHKVEGDAVLVHTRRVFNELSWCPRRRSRASTGDHGQRREVWAYVGRINNETINLGTEHLAGRLSGFCADCIFKRLEAETRAEIDTNELERERTEERQGAFRRLPSDGWFCRTRPALPERPCRRV
jgi:hypothetical protein